MNYSIDKDRLDFARRLNDSLDKISYPAKHAGRQVQLAKDIGVSQKGARRWLEGEAIPRKGALQKVAKLIHVNASWLRDGGSMQAANERNSGPAQAGSESANLPNLKVKGYLPVMDMTAVGRELDYEPINDRVVMYTGEHAETAKACANDSESMAPDIPKGCTLIYTGISDREPNVGDYVIARNAAGGRVFRKLEEEGGELILRALNLQYPLISEGFKVLAVVLEFNVKLA